MDTLQPIRIKYSPRPWYKWCYRVRSVVFKCSYKWRLSGCRHRTFVPVLNNMFFFRWSSECGFDPFRHSPSISTSSWFSVFSCSLCPPKFPRPRFRPTASISSMNSIQGAFFLAITNRSLTCTRGDIRITLRQTLLGLRVCVCVCVCVCVSHSGRANAHEHLQELRAVDSDEGYVGFTSRRFGQQSLSCSGRAR